MKPGLLPCSIALCVAAASYATPAHADPTHAECVAANEKAQALQNASKLRDARSQLLVCIVDACPDVVRRDCVQRLKDVEDATPTIVFGAKDGAGHDLVDVQVTMDGATVASRLDGTALQVDPGAHDFVFQTAGVDPLKQSFVIRQGEKDRHEVVVLGPQPATRCHPRGIGKSP